MNLIDEINKEIEEEKKLRGKNFNDLSVDEQVNVVHEHMADPLDSEQFVETAVKLSEEQPPKKKRGRPAKIDEKVFIEMWNAALESGSLDEVAKMIGSSPASTAVKASNLRKRGVHLGRFKRGRRKKVK